MSIEKLNSFREGLTVDGDSKAVDIRGIGVNTADSTNNRIIKFIDDVKNPYKYKVDNVVVKINFDDNGKTFEDAIIDYYKTAV